MDHEYGFNDVALKACLYQHFEELIKRKMREENGEGEADDIEAENLMDQQESAAIPGDADEAEEKAEGEKDPIQGEGGEATPNKIVYPDSQPYEIVDINLAKKDVKDIVHL